MKLDPHVPPFTKINTTWIKDINIRHKTTKGKHRGKHQDIGLGKDLLNKTSKAKINEIISN